MMQPVEIVQSPWSPALVTALFGGMVGMIGAITALLLALSAQRREARIEAEARRKDAEAAALAAAQIHGLVNGANTALLARIERLTAQVAAFTGAPRDLDAAEDARVEVDAKSRVTAEIAEGRP